MSLTGIILAVVIVGGTGLFIGVFLGVLYGWIFIDIIWPSIAGLLALMLVGGMKPGMLLNKSFGDPIVVMMFFIFVFCATINYYGLSKFISL